MNDAIKFYLVKMGGCSARGIFPYYEDEMIPLDRQSTYGLAVLLDPKNRGPGGIPIPAEVRLEAARLYLQRLNGIKFGELSGWSRAAYFDAVRLLRGMEEAMKAWGSGKEVVCIKCKLAFCVGDSIYAGGFSDNPPLMHDKCFSYVYVE
jgi:hypothetical protein